MTWQWCLDHCVICIHSYVNIFYMRLLLKIHNKIGLSSDPWGTPLFSIGWFNRDFSKYVTRFLVMFDSFGGGGRSFKSITCHLWPQRILLEDWERALCSSSFPRLLMHRSQLLNNWCEGIWPERRSSPTPWIYSHSPPLPPISSRSPSSSRYQPCTACAAGTAVVDIMLQESVREEDKRREAKSERRDCSRRSGENSSRCKTSTFTKMYMHLYTLTHTHICTVHGMI